MNTDDRSLVQAADRRDRVPPRACRARRFLDADCWTVGALALAFERKQEIVIRHGGGDCDHPDQEMNP